MWFMSAQVIELSLVPGCSTQNHGDPISRDAIVVTTAVTSREGRPKLYQALSALPGIVEIVAKERRDEETSNTHRRFR